MLLRHLDGIEIKKLLVALIAFSLISGSANAATKKPSPTPTPTKKVSAKATVKASAKPIVKTTAKPTVKTTAKASATPTKKKVVYKPKPRKKVKVLPSPSAIWPPKGYAQNGDIYAKIPTSKELIGLASSNSKLAKDLASCETLTCGAILAASLAGCTWWEFNADVIGPISDTDSTIIKYGSLTSLFTSSKPKQILPFIMVSEEVIKNGFVVSGIKIACHRESIPTDLKVPSNTYVKAS